MDAPAQRSPHTGPPQSPHTGPGRGPHGTAGNTALVALVVALLAVVAIGVRVASVCDGDVACALVAGDLFTDPVESGLPVTEGEGYDAQFFHRQVRSPFNVSMDSVNGVEFDTEVRYGRIGYPLLGWVLTGGGQPAAVPWAMFAIGVLSLAALGWVLAEGARDAGRSPWWGAVAAAIPGVWFAAGRGLADPLSAALVGAGALALSRRRYGLAALAFTAAALTKEQAVLVAAMYGLWRVAQLLLGRRHGATEPTRPGAQDLPWVVPGAVFALWHVALLLITGTMPAGESGGAHLVAPFSDLVPALVDWLSPSGASEAMWLLEVVVLVSLAVLVVFARTSAGWERAVAVLGVVMLAAVNDNVFVDPAHFRQFSDIAVVLCLAAFRADPRWWVPLMGANAALSAGVVVRLAAAL